MTKAVATVAPFEISAEVADALARSGRVTNDRIKCYKDIGIPYNRRLGANAILVLRRCGIDNQFLGRNWNSMFLIDGRRLKLSVKLESTAELIDHITGERFRVYDERMDTWLFPPWDVQRLRSITMLGSGSRTTYVLNAADRSHDGGNAAVLGPLDEDFHLRFAINGRAISRTNSNAVEESKSMPASDKRDKRATQDSKFDVELENSILFEDEDIDEEAQLDSRLRIARAELEFWKGSAKELLTTSTASVKATNAQTSEVSQGPENMQMALWTPIPAEHIDTRRQDTSISVDGVTVKAEHIDDAWASANEEQQPFQVHIKKEPGHSSDFLSDSQRRGIKRKTTEDDQDYAFIHRRRKKFVVIDLTGDDDHATEVINSQITATLGDGDY